MTQVGVHTGPVMDRLTEIGIQMALLVRRRHAAREELSYVNAQLEELESEIHTSTTGQLFGMPQAARIPDPPEHVPHGEETVIIQRAVGQTAVVNAPWLG
jgi:hypothetical protein